MAMTAATNSRARYRTGIALSPTQLCVVDMRLRGSADRSWRAELEAPPADATTWPSLASALVQLAGQLGQPGALDISLMPPFTEVRRLALPPLGRDEMQRVLSRGASRYFVGARGPQVVGASPATRRRRGEMLPVVAAAASARLVEAIRSAAESAGFAIESIAPAESAWASGAFALWPAFTRQPSFAIICQDERTHVLELDGKRLAGVRRFRDGSADAQLIADTVTSAARVGIAGDSRARHELAAALNVYGVNANVAGTAGEWSSAAERPELLAAHFAGGDAGPTLRADNDVAIQRAGARRLAWRLAGAAAALLLLAAGIELWGVKRQLAQVRAERERLRPEIASTLLGRSTVDATYRELTSLNAIERAAPHWSSVLVTLSQSVPEDAFLTAIRAREDSLIIDGMAPHAKKVFDAMQNTSGLLDVRASAPVRRETQDDGVSLEHFAIAARVESARRVAKPATAPASNPAPASGAGRSGQ
jgi:Tfp pilus assembly protein PilN